MKIWIQTQTTEKQYSIKLEQIWCFSSASIVLVFMSNMSVKSI